MFYGLLSSCKEIYREDKFQRGRRGKNPGLTVGVLHDSRGNVRKRGNMVVVNCR